jgi:predicted esterase
MTSGPESERDDVLVQLVETAVHGRYLVVPPAVNGPVPLLVGFHGYGENAAMQLRRLEQLESADGWLKVSIQGLYRFYARDHRTVVASWMTSEDRLHAIDDNFAYVSKVLQNVKSQLPTTEGTVFAGFSQGVSMAFRAAAHHPGARVLAVGGNIPPELDGPALSRVAGVVYARGTSDHLYSAEQFQNDKERLRAADVPLRTITFAGGHEWSPELGSALEIWNTL